jgi:hypothetical protein
MKNPQADKNHHGFVSKSACRALSAEQTLRAYCTGGMMDNRLEIGCFSLLHKLGRSWGPWIGDDIPKNSSSLDGVIPSTSLSSKLDQRFVICEQSAKFLSVHRTSFLELDQKNRSLAEVGLEYILPKNRSAETLVVIPFAFHGNELVVGLEERFLPAAQKFFNTSHLYCSPAWRLTQEECVLPLEKLIGDKMKNEFGIYISSSHILGSGYMPSPGTSPETCTVFAANVRSVKSTSADLKFYNAKFLSKNMHQLHSGHLLTVVYRLLHSLGLSD